MLKEKLINEFNQLGISDMPNVTELNELEGKFINLEFKLPSGQIIKIWDDNKIYYGNQLIKLDGLRCYGLVADETHLLVCEYGENGAEAEIIVFKRL